ncbi:uncharacterized protein F5891DRAFT_1028030 [Suillus fuscotomentosus]|uniref:Uncharacterized protein n=1 Tax=Suillus fuscotomentosus TaxID=1912939 RepID=A0AAD4E9D7_9AGAM|nr:uncharacterized protein F5891DRAFT_1028030 [Suillus fuscotomentosus]KAG1865760.1 hypothetical protein C8R48DRAFT_705928 [Suillus tomentosus]KAG1901787.1 hypothetical protein F5891DRAFT_1028030 [Suillus fuscotomentosus]
MFKKYLPVMMLTEREFLAAWWQMVKCRRALWERGVHHCNVSLSNIMGYHSHGQFIGVLNDYDLIVVLPSSYIPPTMNCIYAIL